MRRNIKIKFSQNFITYHGCSNCYIDGTNEIANTQCSKATFNPFRKRPIDVNSKIWKSTRTQIKKKPYATKIYVKKYFRYLKFLENNKDTQWSDYSDYETASESETELEKRWSKTGEDLVIDIKPEVETTQTGKDLIIDIKLEVETKQENLANNIKAELETKQQTPNNK